MKFSETLMFKGIDTMPPICYTESMKEQVDKMTFRLPKSVAKKLRVKVAQQEDTIQKVCEQAVAEYLNN